MMSRDRLLLIAGVALPALACAIIGLAHPRILDLGTAGAWQGLHIALIPVFPLVGLAPWLIARKVDRRLGWVAAVFGYGFATLYTALDILAGVGGGALWLGGRADATEPIFEIARVLARIGVWSLVLGILVAGVAVASRAGIRALPGLVLAGVGAYFVYEGHIYFPVGALAFGAFALGSALLAVVVTGERATPRTPAPSSQGEMEAQR